MTQAQHLMQMPRTADTSAVTCHAFDEVFRKTSNLHEKEGFLMTNKIRGGAFRLTGLILGIVGATVSLTAIVFSTIGLHQAHLCKTCKKGEEFK